MAHCETKAFPEQVSPPAMLAFADDAALSRLVIAAGRNAVHVYGLDLWSS